MGVEVYRFFLRDTDGTPLAWIPPDSFLYFEYDKRVNDIGHCQGIISNTITPELKDVFSVENTGNLDAILEVWRRPRSLKGFAAEQFELDAEFLIRYNREELLNDGRSRITIIGRSPMSLIARCEIYPGNRINAVADIPQIGEEAIDFPVPFLANKPVIAHFQGFPQTAQNNSSTTKKMHAAVRRSATVSNVNALGAVNVIADGSVVDAGIINHWINERYKYLLDFLQRASAAAWYAWFYGFATEGGVATAGVDFDLVRTAPAQWEFTTFPDGRGVDKRVNNPAGNFPLILSPKLNNVIQPVRVLDRIEEKTRVIVAGDGRDELRDILRVANTLSESASPWNQVEEYIDSRRIEPFSTQAGVDQAVADGHWRLKEKGVRREFTMLVRQTDAMRYQADFNLGDLVTADYLGKTDDFQITSIRIVLSATNNESIDIELGKLDGSFRPKRELRDQIANLSGDILRKLREISAGE